jgi:hypothetical protein
MLHDQDEPRECADEFHKTPAPVEAPMPESMPEPVSKPVLQSPSNKPVCPHCGSPEGKILGSMTTLGGRFKVMAVYCAACHKYLGFFQPLELEVIPPPTPGVH